MDSSNSFIIDSGASAHICNKYSLFNSFKSISNRYIKTATGERVPIHGVGNIGILNDVLYAPGLTCNLISVSKLDAEGHTLVFSRGNVLLDGVKFGSVSDKLYTANNSIMQTLDSNSSAHSAYNVVDEYSEVSTLTSNIPKDFHLLHRRYGHADVNMIRRLITVGAVDGLYIPERIANPNTFHCDACSMTKAVKQARIRHLAQNHGGIHDKNLYFTAVYSDVLGPIQPVALGGYQYGVTFTEVNSRYRYFYPLKQKSDVLQAFMSLVAEVSSLGFKVKLLRSDNGGEYTSIEFQLYCKSNNIHQRFTSPNTPSSNSISERFNRILGERARAMLYGSKLPKFLWAEAMAAVTYLYNRSLSPVDSTKTPYELLFNVKPNVANLRAYGCVTYMYNFDVSRTKLDNRAIRGVLVGYDLKSSSYLVYIPELNTVRRSGHCTFNEHELFFDSDSLAKEELKSSRKPKQQTLASMSTQQQAIYNSDPNAILPAPVTQSPGTPTVVTNNIIPAVPSTTIPGIGDSVTVEHPPLITSALNSPIPAEPTATTSPNQRISKRKRSPPAKLADYRLLFTSDEQFNQEALLTSGSDFSLLDDVPKTFKSIEGRTDKEHWYQAIQSENDSLRNRGVFIPTTDIPPGTNIIKSKFIFKRKVDGRYKARLVAKGFSQVLGPDYWDVFAPVVSKHSLRVLLSIAAVKDYHIHQIDVETAFLYGDLDEILYMEAPDGSDFPKGTVLRLLKSIYGLKQAPRQWNLALHKWISDRSFKQSAIDCGVYIHGPNHSATYLAVYVDDILILGHDLQFINSIKSDINQTFTIKDLGEVHHILGMEVVRDRVNKTISLSQGDYLRKLILKYRLDPDKIYSSKPVPITKSTFKNAVDTSKNGATNIEGTYPFRSALGGILYANTCTRPDISFTVSALASHCSNPQKMHWNALMDLLRYISDTKHLAITYGGPNVHNLNQLEVYADADFSKNPDIRKSRSGFVIYLNGGPIAWNSTLQKTIAMSTTESELYAMYDGVNQVLWFRELLNELGFVQDPITCHEDNTGLLDWIINQRSSTRMKAIPLKYYKLREYRQMNICNFTHIPTDLQKADILTKQMDFTLFDRQIKLLYNL